MFLPIASVKVNIIKVVNCGLVLGSLFPVNPHQIITRKVLGFFKTDYHLLCINPSPSSHHSIAN